MKKNYKTIGLVSILVIILSVLLITYLNGGSNKLKKNNKESIFVEESDDSQTKETVSLKSNEIVVEIKGEVNKPDIYWMKEEEIIADLIIKAGGLTDKADISSINRAEKLKNHQSIVIPNIDNKNIAQGNVTTNTNVAGNSNLININTATESELDSLPGIGPSRAKDIIKYREQNGGFNSIEDLKDIKGIGDKSFEDLKDKVSI